MEAVSSVTLAHPNGGPPLPVGVPAIVDESEEFTKAHLNAGYIVPAKNTGTEQVWDENADAIRTGATTDLSNIAPPPSEDADTDASASKSGAKSKGA